jgi:hypothetical protein
LTSSIPPLGTLVTAELVTQRLQRRDDLIWVHAGRHAEGDIQNRLGNEPRHSGGANMLDRHRRVPECGLQLCRKPLERQ